MRSTTKQIRVIGAVLTLFIIVVMVLTACAGPQGAAGPRGAAGPAGAAGAPGMAATAPTATIVVSPTTMVNKFARSFRINVAGSGFVPGEAVVVALKGGLTAGEVGRVDIYLTTTDIIVNDQGAFSAALGFGRLSSLDVNAYSIMAVGDMDSVAEAPLVIIAAPEE
ncbi:hypothetical protein ACFLU4_01350 [Chloroflexota bacterium]